MRFRLPLTFGLLLLVSLPFRGVAAQVVRGQVTERNTGVAVSGVLVTLDRVGGDSSMAGARPPVSTLTDEQGTYALRAPAPGRYAVSAKRIGVQRFVSDAFELGSGETRQVDIVLDAVLYVLPVVRIASLGMCVTRGSDAQRVESLWDEARTALMATQISMRDRLFDAHLSRYVRELDPRSLKVLSESRTELRGVVDRPFTSLSGDSLSKAGFWWPVDENTAIYNVPDAEVLTSSAFRRDHCFSLVEGSRERQGLLGLGFEPIGVRPVNDIRGTLWLDARSFDLEFVEFRYTGLESAPGTESVGGEVHFARLPSGAWIVRRWFMRMPQYAQYISNPVRMRGETVLVRPASALHRLVEEGGDVFAEGVRLFERPASIDGVVVDSVQRPFAGVAVRLAGTPFTVRSDTGGRFRLDSLPGGRFSLVAEHEGYAALGQLVDDQVVELEEGVRREVRLRAAGTKEIVERLCDGKGPVPRRTTLRLMMLDSATTAPLGNLPVWLRWPRSGGRAPGTGAIPMDGIESRTDVRGITAFCNVPADVPLELLILRPFGEPVHVTVFRLGRDDVVGRIVLTRRPR